MEVYKTLGKEERKEYETVKDTILNAFRAEDISFTSSTRFHDPMLTSNESATVSLRLKDLLSKEIFSRHG